MRSECKLRNAFIPALPKMEWLVGIRVGRVTRVKVDLNQQLRQEAPVPKVKTGGRRTRVRLPSAAAAHLLNPGTCDCIQNFPQQPTGYSLVRVVSDRLILSACGPCCQLIRTLSLCTPYFLSTATQIQFCYGLSIP
jgi:hypothetical protein